MMIGDENITREDMPSFTAFQMNPDHLRQSFQDVLNAKLGGGMVMPQQTSPEEMGMMNTKEETSTQWK